MGALGQVFMILSSMVAPSMIVSWLGGHQFFIGVAGVAGVFIAIAGLRAIRQDAIETDRRQFPR